MHRFKQDPEWGELLKRWRDEQITIEDINMINKRLITEKTVLPGNIKYATFYNKDRDAINAGLFQTRCKRMQENKNDISDSIIVFSDDIFMRNSAKKYQRLKNVQRFWRECAEDDIKLPQGKGRMDPVLRLYKGIQVMLTQNINVTAGLANGTQATVETIALKQGTKEHYVNLDEDIEVQAVLANDIEYVAL